MLETFYMLHQYQLFLPGIVYREVCNDLGFQMLLLFVTM